MFYILLNSINFKKAKTTTHSDKRNTQNELENCSNNHELHHNSFRRANHFSIDCSKSTSGLFLGIFILLITIISLITYFVYKKHNPYYAENLTGITELALICLSMFLVILTWINLKYNNFYHSVSYKKLYSDIKTLFILIILKIRMILN